MRVSRLAPAFAGLVLALAATAAAARDYIVVLSNDPAVTRGQAFDAGVRVPLAPGRTLTLMHASGDLLKVQGAAGGVVLPKRTASQAEADRLAILKVIVAPAEAKTAGGVALRKTRGGVCPAPAMVTTLDAVVQVHQAGCATEAAQALDAWIAAHTPTD
jgi:hypothetical protein